MSTVTLDFSQLVLLVINVATVVGAFWALRGDIREVKTDVKNLKDDVEEVKSDIGAVKKKADERGRELEGIGRDVAVLRSHVKIEAR